MSRDDTQPSNANSEQNESPPSTEAGERNRGRSVPGEYPELNRNELPGPRPEERPQPEGRRNEQGIRVDPGAEAEKQSRVATISALVRHEPGVLSRVSGLFSRRQFNIESLTVGPTENEEYARITIVVDEPEPGVEQIEKQLGKLVPVVAVHELPDDAIQRELALVKVGGDAPDKVGALADMYGAKTVDSTADAITVEITGSKQKIEAAIEAFDQFDVREVKRTGTAALARGETETNPSGKWATDETNPDRAQSADASNRRPTNSQ